MNRRQEDALVRLAFGDVTPEEATALEREMANDPEASKALASYRRMREGLRDLHDIPQDQLSKERLRHAILSQGLKPRPVSSGTSWLWMPAAAAVLAFGIVFVRNLPSPSGAPVAIVGESRPDFVKNSETPKIEFSPGSSESTSLRENVADKVGASVATATTTVARRKSTSMVATNARVRRNSTRSAQPSDREGWMAVVPNTDDASPSMTVATNEGGPSGSAAPQDPIIIIQAEKDGDTGAQKASEVGSASNVITSG
jgi:hypothetical protein